MSERFQAAHLTEMQAPQPNPDVTWAAIRHHVGVSSFGINAWTGSAGAQVISEHDELGGRSPQHEELYLVVSGRATFTIDGETVDAPAGTVVFVRDPAARRGAVAVVDDTTILAVGAKPGEVFTPSKWERSAPVLAHFANGEYEQAQALLTALLEEDPDDPTVLYNLACAESLLGRSDDAVGHLQRSVRLDASFRELAKSDTDFDAVRDDPRFVELVG